MMLKREAPTPKPASSARWLRRLGAGLAATVAAMGLAAGCLQRPVVPQDPQTSNLFVDQIRQTAVDKIDLLFMIDNSISMADKQEILRDAVPVLVERLIAPACVDANGNPTGGNATNGQCAQGEPEFSPIQDIHIGIVTSSIGDNGGDTCLPRIQPPNDTNPNYSEDDQAHLLGTEGLRPVPLPSWNRMGFLAWDPDTQRPRNNPPGITQRGQFISAFQEQIAQTGEEGCGYEASLESWYRFLIDPEPPVAVTQVNGESTPGMVDQVILEQRAAFLRHDSLVAIVMLTDENDCSIVDYGQGWLVGMSQSGTVLPRATSICESDPNNQCCMSCQTHPDYVPSGCTQPAQDPACADPTHALESDHPNLRCWDQKRRFGFDLLHPIERYVQGLYSTQLYPRTDQNGDGVIDQADLVVNPLYAAPEGGSPRDKSLVFLAGIVGVPWQDVSDEESWTDPRRLRYLTYDELEAEGRWAWMLSENGQFPQDGLMVETQIDRTTNSAIPQTHPGLGYPLASAASTSQTENPINGHEFNDPTKKDLQYACIFPLTQTRDCQNAPPGQGCDCKPDDVAANRPLCQGTTQTHAKAYPGTRILQVLRAYGSLTKNSIVASICPKVTQSADPSSDPDYGYNPAVNAIVDRLKDALKGKCLPRPLDVEPGTGRVPCTVIEAIPPTGGECPACGSNLLPDRINPTSPEIDPVVRQQLASDGFCGGATGVDCSSFCLCEVQQYEGQALNTCQTQQSDPTSPKGYCYVDGLDNDGNPSNQESALLANCPASERQLLRFASEVPVKGAIAFIACLGKSLSGAGAQAM
ncbi:MAG TPA: hypothetical protein VKY73_11250 [Polyangiaceae bacterium]|nr:hypothetical protein [Polyangiaceae bacterium]